MAASHTTTLRDQRGSRSPLYSKLQKPIYITQPNILIPLLEDAAFDRLPWYYQARTLEEAYTGRETPFVWNYLQAGATRERRLEEEQARCKCTVHFPPTPLLPAKKLRRVGKRITFIIKREDIPKYTSQRTITSPSTPSSLDSPTPQLQTVGPKPYTLKIKLPATSFRPVVTGAQMVAGVGLFRDTARRIRTFQRGGSFVWVIKPIHNND